MLRKYATRYNGKIVGYVLSPNSESDQEPIDESSQEWIDYLNYVPDVSIASKLGVMRYLKGTGEWGQVKTLLSQNDDAKDEWDAASELHIDDPTLIAMAAALGWDSAKLQSIFNAVEQ